MLEKHYHKRHSLWPIKSGTLLEDLMITLVWLTANLLTSNAREIIAIKKILCKSRKKKMTRQIISLQLEGSNISVFCIPWAISFSQVAQCKFDSLLSFFVCSAILSHKVINLSHSVCSWLHLWNKTFVQPLHTTQIIMQQCSWILS